MQCHSCGTIVRGTRNYIKGELYCKKCELDLSVVSLNSKSNTIIAPTPPSRPAIPKTVSAPELLSNNNSNNNDDSPIIETTPKSNSPANKIESEKPKKLADSNKVTTVSSTTTSEIPTRTITPTSTSTSTPTSTKTPTVAKATPSRGIVTPKQHPIVEETATTSTPIRKVPDQTRPSPNIKPTTTTITPNKVSIPEEPIKTTTPIITPLPQPPKESNTNSNAATTRTKISEESKANLQKILLAGPPRTPGNGGPTTGGPTTGGPTTGGPSALKNGLTPVRVFPTPITPVVDDKAFVPPKLVVKYH